MYFWTEEDDEDEARYLCMYFTHLEGKGMQFKGRGMSIGSISGQKDSVTCRRKDALKGLRKISGMSVDKEELLVGVVGFFLHLKLSELKSLDLTI